MNHDHYEYTVPEQKKIRVIVNTDAKNEADDQFAIVHHLLTPRFVIKGMIAAHFERKFNEGKEESMEKSYEEIKTVLSIMGMEEQVGVYRGAVRPMKDEQSPELSEGAELIIKEALTEDSLPLYVVFLGTLTDLAAAYLHKPEIAKKINVVWIGGGEWPVGGFEFNLMQDIHAANIVFQSDIPLMQVPKNVYKMIRVTLAELQVRVKPYGAIGEYLFRQMMEYNAQYAFRSYFPQGESWCLGDQPTVSLLIEHHEHDFDWKPAPRVSQEMFYIHGQNARPIKVFKNVDARLTMEDFYCKMAINYPAK